MLKYVGFDVYLRTIRYGIKIIFCGYSKPLSLEIVKNGWRPAECPLNVPERLGNGVAGFAAEV